MGLLDFLFGKNEAKKPVSHQLPSSIVAKEFGEVNVAKNGGNYEVTFTILMEPTDAEGWQTGVAVDASGSMSGAFGKGLEDGPKGSMPQALFEDYVRRGWIQIVTHQGNQIPVLNDECKQDLVRRGHFVWSKNDVQPLVRRVTSYLAANLDADGGTTVIYWACGPEGKDIDVIGDLVAEDCDKTEFSGPAKYGFGNATCLTPAVRYFVERFADAKNGVYIFITDGELNDLPEVKKYTIKLCKDVAAKRRNPIKCVLVGIGDNINEQQMEELDDLDSGTEVDIWDHKIARDMRAMIEIFAEVVSENQMVASTGRLLDASGNVIKVFSDGVPAKIKFLMPTTSTAFELDVGGQRIRQSVVTGR